MSEVTLDDVFKELPDEIAKAGEELAETLTQPPQELTPVDKDALFADTVKYLNRIGHEIEDIAGVATRMIAERRNHYNRVFDKNKHFLKEYAIDHLKRDKDGQIKGKSYKTLEAGGGIFFRQKPERIHADETKLSDLKTFIERYLPDKIEVIAEKTVYWIPDTKELIDILINVAHMKATEIVENLAFGEGVVDHEQIEHEISIATQKGMEEICNEFNIEIEPADPFFYMFAGSAKANTFRSIKANITQAIDGRFRADEEDVDLLIEELE